ncbi:MAG: TPM domain-containing protein [Bacteroidia bacterium]|nr:TPM domain-containing protein [Bacteroidia bacterium]
MLFNKKFIFSDVELQAIQQRIVDCEHEISGEIRIAYATASNTYTSAALWGGVWFMWTGTLVYLLVEELFYKNSFIAFFQVNYLVLLQSILFIGGALLTSRSFALKRLFSRKKSRTESVKEKAETIFLEKEIFATRQRTGILIYISLLEHQVYILPDTGIKARVKDKEWKAVTGMIVAGIKRKKPADGTLEAITACRDLLLKNGFRATPDDTNELPNDIILA